MNVLSLVWMGGVTLFEQWTMEGLYMRCLDFPSIQICHLTESNKISII